MRSNEKTRGEKNYNATLTDAQVMELRKEYRKKPFLMAPKSRSLGLNNTTLKNALIGDTFKHLPYKCKPVKIPRFKLSTEQVDDLRREFKEKPFSRKDRAAEFGMSYGTLTKYLKGTEIPNTKEPVIPRRAENDADVLRPIIIALREEYLCQPFALRPKAEELGVNVGTLSRALRGLIYKNLPGGVEIKPSPSKRGRGKVYDKLSSIIVRIREEYAQQPFTIASKAKELKVSRAALKNALVGDTYKELPGRVEIKNGRPCKIVKEVENATV